MTSDEYDLRLLEHIDALETEAANRRMAVVLWLAVLGFGCLALGLHLVGVP